jgi:hypothetical protein
MPIPVDAINTPPAINLLLRPARPLPASPNRPESHLPLTGETESPIMAAMIANASAVVRGIIGSTSTVGPNAAHIGAPGIAGMARQHAAVVRQDATQAIGNHVDRKA